MFYAVIEIKAGKIDKKREIKVSPNFSSFAKTEKWIEDYLVNHGTEETPEMFVKSDEIDDREFGLEYIS